LSVPVYECYSKTGNDAAVRWFGGEFKREETGKLENLYFFSFLQENGRVKVVFLSSPHICTTLVSGQVCSQTVWFNSRGQHSACF
jgi:hypothetical protein